MELVVDLGERSYPIIIKNGLLNEINNEVKKIYKGKKIFMGLCKLLPTKPFWRLAVKGSADSKFVHSFFAAASKCSKNIYPREYISHTTNASFEGAEYPISKHYDSLLKILYGDYMQLPPPEERKIKQHAVIVDLNNSYEKYLDYHKELKFDDLSQSIR